MSSRARDFASLSSIGSSQINTLISLSASGGGGVTVVADITARDAISSPSNGDIVYVLDANGSSVPAAYMRSGSSWEEIYLGPNEGPTFTTALNTTYSLATDGSATVLTPVAADNDGFPITYSFDTTGLGSIASIAQGTGDNTNRFTITPSTNTAHAGSFTFRAIANDGVHVATSTSTLSLAFNYSIDYLVIGGGGGASSGGGGAGALLYRTGVNSDNGTVWTATVGAGGAGGAYNTTDASAGSDSTLASNDGSFATVTAGGGGYGGSTDNSSQFHGGNGRASTGASLTSGIGSGGGGGAGDGRGTLNGSASGYAGGGNGGNTGSPYYAAGGGGAGAAGSNATGSYGGAGGTGATNSITGSSTAYAGGGGGASHLAGTPGSGGNGGGGNGVNGTGQAGTANTGGGGGGSVSSNVGGAGGSGVVILRVPTANYTGTTTGSPTVTTDGSYKVITFTSNGTYTA